MDKEGVGVVDNAEEVKGTMGTEQPQGHKGGEERELVEKEGSRWRGKGAG